MNLRRPSAQPNAVTLVRQALRGDLEAFNALVLTYQDLAYNQAYALLGDHATAEDAAQESFIRAYQNLGGFRGGSFRAWLLRIVTNTSLDMLRRSRRHPTHPLFPDDDDGEDMESPAWLADPAPSVQAIVEQNELSRHIYKLLDELPEIYRCVIMLIDVYEFDYQEAAQALGIPIGTVKSRLARARFQMTLKLRPGLEGAVVSANAEERSLGEAEPAC